MNNGWDPWGTKDPAFQMFDDGDAVANDGIYTLQVIFPQGSPTRVVYKYGIESDDNEAVAATSGDRNLRDAAR